MNYVDLMKRHMGQVHHDDWTPEKVLDLVLGGSAHVMDMGNGNLQLVVYITHKCTDLCYKVVD